MLVRALTTLLAVSTLVAPAAAASGRLSLPRGKREIRARLHQDFGSARRAQLRDCFQPLAGAVQCRVVARVFIPGGLGYRCHKHYRAERTRRGIRVLESRGGLTFRTFAPARCRLL